MTNILVTGGRGFIGTNLTKELRSRGHEVVTCDVIQGEDPHHIKADVYVYQQMTNLSQAIYHVPLRRAAR
jgi:dTDP-glucose 4,6-dehydratase